MRDRSLVALTVAGLVAVIAGATVGVLAGTADDQVELGRVPTTIGGKERIELVRPVPPAREVPPLSTTTSEPEQSVEATPETESAYEPKEEYVPPAEEKTPYVPPPPSEPAPDITVGKNE